jgi:hypothetical protein
MLANVAIAAVSNLSSVSFPSGEDVRVLRVALADRLLEIQAIMPRHIDSSWRTKFLGFLTLVQVYPKLYLYTIENLHCVNSYHSLTQNDIV